MNQRFAKAAPCGSFMALALLAACSAAPSRAPLGGNYAISPQEPSRDRQAQDSGAEAKPVAPNAPEAAPAAKLAVAAVADAATAPASSDLLRYDPLKAGDELKGEASLSLDAEAKGSASMKLVTRFRIDLKVGKTSSEALEALELTLVPVSLHSEFAGHASDMQQFSTKVFDITLGGNTPTVRERGGAPLDGTERAVLILLVTPLAYFHERWAHSPTLELKPGWSVKLPVPTPPTMSGSNDTLHVGPISARYDGRSPGSDRVPFQIALPVEFNGELGKLSFDLTGTASLSTAKARPLAIELSGSLSGSGGPISEANFRGNSKLAVTLSYL